jgi:hypothetical protein
MQFELLSHTNPITFGLLNSAMNSLKLFAVSSTDASLLASRFIFQDMARPRVRRWDATVGPHNLFEAAVERDPRGRLAYCQIIRA